MKIISQGRKDYYDYLQGVYGFDEAVIFDRSKANTIQMNDETPVELLQLFSKEILPTDKKRQWTRKYIHKKWTPVLTTQKYFFLLEVGYIQYAFCIERYIEDDGNLCIIPQLLRKYDVGLHASNDPIGIFYSQKNSMFIEDNDVFGDDGMKRYIRFSKRDNKLIGNVLLKDTCISGFIPAEDIYNQIYDYLIHIRESQVEDKRTDVQKLESKGFDKVTSFRNIK